MFALEISFRDGISQPETVFLRRPQALSGSQDVAHVVLEDMRELDYQIRVVKDLGRRFKVLIVGEEIAAPDGLEGTYDERATLELGPVTLQITSLDSDLLLREGETPDRAGM